MQATEKGSSALIFMHATPRPENFIEKHCERLGSGQMSDTGEGRGAGGGGWRRRVRDKGFGRKVNSFSEEITW